MPCAGLVSAHLRVDALGGAAERELAKRDEVPLAKKLSSARIACVGHVHLALAQAPEELVDGQVDEAHVVGFVEHGVGHRLAHGDAGDLRDDVVQALEVLHVERREDVDAGVEELFDVLPALDVTTTLGAFVCASSSMMMSWGVASAPRRGRAR